MNTRKRNYTEAEKAFLLHALVPYKSIIENKQTDGASVKIKNDAWDAIASKYNASHIVNERATGKQLSRLWLNIKSKQRSQLTRERQHRMATGGGGAVSDVEIDPLVSLIAPGLIVEIPSNDSAQQFNLDPPEQQSTSCSDIRPSDETAIDKSQPEAILAEGNAPTASTSIPMRRTSSQYSGETRLSFSQRQLQQTEQVKRTCIQHEMAQRQRREDELHELRKDILLSQSREAKARALLAELEVEMKNLNLKYIYLLQ